MNRYALTFLLLTTLCIGGCVAPSDPDPTLAPMAAPLPEPTPLPEVGLHFLLTGSGSDAAQIKRLHQGWTAFHPAAWGTTTQRGDLIQPPPGSTVTILCADLTLHTLSAEGGSPCQVSQPALFWNGTRIVNPMSPNTVIPRLLYPRSTHILEERPLLRWQDNGASHYTVAIVRGGEVIWTQTGVAEHELRYPDDAPPLQAGQTYLLEVRDEDSGASSADDPHKGLGFQRVTDEELATIRQQEAAIMALPLAEVEKQFALANYYAGQRLFGEALTALELVGSEIESPKVGLWHGRVLTAITRYEEAEAAYTAASALAATLGDLESQAQAETLLWELTGNSTHRDNALTLYQQLGDTEAIAALQN